MKKITLHSLLFIACFAFITSCAKDVKTPSKTTNPSTLKKGGTTTTTTNTGTTQTGSSNTNSGGCSGSHSNSNNDHSYGG